MSDPLKFVNYFDYSLAPSKIDLGTSSVPQTLTAGTPLQTLYSTSSSTDGSTSVEPVLFNSVMTGIGGVGGRTRVNMSTDVRLGGWANAFKAQVECNDNGGSVGLMSVGCFEMVFPKNGLGNFTCIELEATTPADTFTGAQNFQSFILCNSTGSTTGAFQDYAAFVHFEVGLVAGTGNMIGAGNSTIRVAFGTNQSTDMYIPLSSAEASYTTAYPIVSTYSGGNAISVTVTAATTSAYTGITVNNSFTKTNGGVHKGISSTVTYTPSGGGYSTPIAIAGKVSLGANFDSGTGYIWGVQGQLDLGTSHTINQANSVFAGVRGVITGTTPVFTDADEICCVYADNLCATNMAGLSTGSSSFFRAQNSGGTVDNFLHLWGANNVSNFVSFESTGGATPMISGGAATHSGTIKKVRCLVDGTVYYFTISTAVS